MASASGAPKRRGRPGHRSRILNSSATWLLVGGASILGLAFSPLAIVAYLLAAPAAFLAGAILVARRAFAVHIEFVLWCWFLAPFLRRVVELQVGFQPQNYVLLAPAAASLPLGVALLWVRVALPRGIVRGVAGLSAALALGAAMALIQLPIVSLVAGVVAWFPPVILALAILLLPLHSGVLTALLGRTGVVGALVIGVYGIVQWLIVPTWDGTWLDNVSSYPAPSFGIPVPMEIRVFSTLNSPGPAAAALLFCIALASVSTYPIVVKVIAVSAGLACIGLTEVRQTYVAGLVLVVVMVVKRGYSLGATVAVAALIALIILLTPAARNTIGDRVATSVEAGAADQSLQERIAFQRDQFGQALKRPVGLGLGSTGSGARAVAKSNAFGNSDSGYLELLRSLGLVVSAMFLASLVSLSRFMGKSENQLVLLLYSLTLTVPVQLLLGNVFTSSTGVVVLVALFAGVRIALEDSNIYSDCGIGRNNILGLRPESREG